MVYWEDMIPIEHLSTGLSISAESEGIAEADIFLTSKIGLDDDPDDRWTWP